VGAASGLEIHDVSLPATHLIRHRSVELLSNAKRAREGRMGLESKFLNQRRKSCTQTEPSQTATYCKKKFTNPSSKSRPTDFSKRFIPLWG
jgi:hypothetical protein